VKRAAARLGLLAAAAVGAAYLVQVPQRLPLAGPLAAATLDGFHASEDGFRWSTPRATVRFPDPGPGERYLVELDVSAWRPRGHGPVLVTLSAGTAVRQASVSSRRQTVAVEASTSGAWRSDLVIVLDAEAFRPGLSDSRVLGARVHQARLVPLDGVLGLRLPPAGQVVAVALATVLSFLSLVGMGTGVRAAERAAGGAAVLTAVAFALARPWAAVLSWPAALAAGVAAVVAWAAPGAVRATPGFIAEMGRALWRGVRTLRPRPASAVACAAVLGVTAAYRAHPRLDIDIGSGEEAPVAVGFSASDGAGGVTFRRPLRGAELDLRDFGGGRPWKITLTASTSGAPRQVILARAGYEELAAPLDGRWATSAFTATAPWGWRSGVALSFPSVPETAGVRLDRVEVDRHGSYPPLRVVVAVLGASLLFVLAAGAAGLTSSAAHAAGALLALAQASALAVVPVGAIPFAVPFAAICLLGVLLAAVLGALRGTLPAGALFAAAGGFVAWLAAAAFPLYRGGHFLFHSNIAEEIWRGRFLLFYLPYPGSTLSRQDQWGSIIVPHPCLFHTVIAPLAALPQLWFHAVEKALLALALATLALLAARIAQRIEGDRAAVGAAVVFATLAPTFQILGLGHTMMLFGVWAASLSIAFVLLRFEELPRPATWTAAVLLLTLCFLSYTASLLFTSLVLAAAVMLLWRPAPASAKALLFALVGAWTLAFGLYYVNWAWPFLSQSLPHIAASSSPSGGPGESWSRLALQPHKLTYTFGSAIVPVLGLAGLFAAKSASRPARVLLLCWAALLVLVGGLDLFFNFLRKHHYFVMVPVAVGGGVLLARLAERGRAGRVAAAVLGVASAFLGLRMAVDVAVGRIP
jgi:hypothetical protein